MTALRLDGALLDFFTVQGFVDLPNGRIVRTDTISERRADELPDARLIEVLEKWPELNDAPWLDAMGVELDKAEVRASMERYLKRAEKSWEGV